MAVPKRRTSKRRQRQRRSHDSLQGVSVSTCANCGEPKRPHRVCNACGWYAGKQAVPASED